MPEIITNPQSVLSFDNYKMAFIVIVIAGVIGFLLWGLDQLFAPISVIPYGIVGFFGRRGSGKSFGMTTYCRRWRMFHKNKPVFTNMEKLILPGDNPPCQCIHVCVHDPNSKLFHSCIELETQTSNRYDPDHNRDDHGHCHYILNKCKAVHTDCTFAQIEACRDGLVAIDEAGIFISSLNFVDRRNRQFARWLVATRHYKCMVLLTAHTPGTINNRLRDVVDQFILMEAYTTLKIFKGLIYDSGAVYGRDGKHSQTVWIPMWWTTARSYNTDSLQKKADAEEVNIIGEDFDIPGLGEAADAKANSSRTVNQTTTNYPSGDNAYVSGVAMDSISSSRVRTNPVSVASSLGSAMPNIDAVLLKTIVENTADTWNGRDKKRPRPIRRKTA